MNSSPPAWLRTASLTAFVSVLLITGILVILILAGIADPRTVGNPVVDDALASKAGWSSYPTDTRWHTQADDFQVTNAAVSSRVYLIAPYRVSCPCTLEIRARQTSGARDAHYGLWWGAGPDQTHTAAGLNSNGYFGVFSFEGNQISSIVDWHIYPWVLPQGEANRLRVNLLEGGIGEILINDEDAAAITWRGTILSIGFVVETTATGESMVTFERLQIWGEIK
jgi:hypothetical protein